MADPLTPNRGYAVPLRGSNVGTWDSPLNTNFTALDSNLGALATVSVASGNNTALTPAQYQCGTIRLTGTLTANALITFPSVQGWWTVDNQCTVGAFSVQLSCGTGNFIAVPPGVATDIFTDGANVGFRNLGRVGEYWDYAGGVVPQWVLACSVPPYLNCDGSALNVTRYPLLAAILGPNASGVVVLPDMRGNLRATYNQGTGRITTGGSGIDGDTRFSVGGVEIVTLTTDQIASHVHANVLGESPHAHTVPLGEIAGGAPVSGDYWSPSPQNFSDYTSTRGGANVSISNANAGQGGAHNNMPPAAIVGLTMIRAA